MSKRERRLYLVSELVLVSVLLCLLAVELSVHTDSRSASGLFEDRKKNYVIGWVFIGIWVLQLGVNTWFQIS